MNLFIKIYLLFVSVSVYIIPAFASDTVIVGQSVSNCNNNAVCEVGQGEATSNCPADCPASSSAVLPGSGSFPIQTIVPVTKVDETPSTEKQPVVSEKIYTPVVTSVIIPEVKIVEIKKRIIPIDTSIKAEIMEVSKTSGVKRIESSATTQSLSDVVVKISEVPITFIERVKSVVKKETNFIKIGGRDMSIRINNYIDKEVSDKERVNFIKIGAQDISVRINKGSDLTLGWIEKVVIKTVSIWKNFLFYLGL